MTGIFTLHLNPGATTVKYFGREVNTRSDRLNICWRLSNWKQNCWADVSVNLSSDSKTRTTKLLFVTQAHRATLWCGLSFICLSESWVHNTDLAPGSTMAPRQTTTNGPQQPTNLNAKNGGLINYKSLYLYLRIGIFKLTARMSTLQMVSQVWNFSPSSWFSSRCFQTRKWRPSSGKRPTSPHFSFSS